MPHFAPSLSPPLSQIPDFLLQIQSVIDQLASQFEEISSSMAEEQRYEQSSAPALCANNCGFFGSPTTLNLCSKCYRDHRLKEQQHQEMESLLSSTTATVKSAPSVSFAESSFSTPDPVDSPAVVVADNSFPSGPVRCGACRKRVGLTGFKCKCGTTYCGDHRYAEQHSCTYDFKGLGKDAISKANPVVKAAKLDHKL